LATPGTALAAIVDTTTGRNEEAPRRGGLFWVVADVRFLARTTGYHPPNFKLWLFQPPFFVLHSVTSVKAICLQVYTDTTTTVHYRIDVPRSLNNLLQTLPAIATISVLQPHRDRRRPAPPP